MSSLIDHITRQSNPLQAIPTGISPSLPQIDGVRFLAWDIYGTLLISGAEEMPDLPAREKTLRSLLTDYPSLPPFSLITHFENLIAKEHARMRKGGIDFPEVRINEIWEQFFDSLSLERPYPIDEFALHFELATNPIWPMPGAAEALSHPATIGVVSNSQFYTPLTLEAFNLPLPQKSFFSRDYRQAKPGRFLFDELSHHGVTPRETLYIGNDRLSDIAPAHQAGFRTALFAGDARSYRPRPDRRDLPLPDAIITSLDQAFQLITE
ncbi:MAG: HAD family hydrolase [Verrucomicrobiaceae bacterium]